MEELDSNKKEASLSALTRRRAQVKGRVTRIKTFVDNFDPKIQSIGLLSARLEALNTCWSEFNVIQGEIDALQVEEVSASETQYEEFESNFFTLKAKLDDFLHSLQSNYIQDRTSNTVSSHAVEPTLRLPEINIPSFSGSYEEWLSFKETYLALIHNNSSLNDIQRFHYLKSCLKDTAVQLIQSLEVSAANYHVAWELLITRFENKKLIVNKHLNSIFQLQNLGKDSASSVRYFLDTLQKHMRALQSLGLPTEHWDAMIVHIIVNKFDQMTRHAWENSTSSTEIATYTELINFLEKRSKVLEGCSEGRKVNSDNVHPSSVPQRKPLPSSRGSFVATNSSKCPICKAFHKLFQCNVFLQLKPSDRISKVRELQLCCNCLKAGHKSAFCASSHSCKTCKKRHNSLLHLDVQQLGNVLLQSPSVTQESSHSTDAQTSSVATCSSSNDSVLLATAIVNIQNNQGSVFPCRMLLDSGSQSNFISESLANSLGLRRYKSSVVVNGINGKLSTIKHNVRTIIRSRFNGYQQELEFSIIPKITDNLPTHLINRQALQVPKKINLADPQFDVPHKVDGLLGAEVFFKLLCIGQIKMQENQPILQKTLLGWVLCGRMNSQEKGQVNNQIYCNFSQSAKLEDLMSSFWEIETNYSNTRLLSYQEKLCEEHYLSHVSRTPSGRIMVQLPFSNEENQLGSSRDQAVLRLESLERRFAKNLPLKQAYTAFMKDYLRLGHMELADDCISEPHYYMPHHPVFKDTSSTTKIRVVFDASSKTSTGVSLNQALMVGPTIQRPSFWGLINPQWPLCTKGRRQSPINVEPDKLLYDPYLRPLHLDKHKVSGTLHNTGQTLVFRIDKDTKHHVNISGGPLAYRYQFEEIYIHYGSENNQGSEHRIQGYSFPAEIQLYGFNAELYHNMSEAQHKSQGIVGISLMVQIGDSPNYELRIITSTLNDVMYRGMSTPIKHLSLRNLLPETDHYMTYEGSTTHPGCWETTVWIIFNKPIYISKHELYAVRKLMQGTRETPKAPLSNNARPLQPLHHRTVRTNIDFTNKEPGKNCPSMYKEMYYKANSWESNKVDMQYTV